MKYVKFLHEVDASQVSTVGIKGASLGELQRDLQFVINVPSGFVVTTAAFREFIHQNKFTHPQHLSDALSTNTNDLFRLAEAPRLTREAIKKGRMPEAVEAEIKQAYETLSSPKQGARVAVRSSAIAEDFGSAFAGQRESYLNVSGMQGILTAIKKCFASLYTPSFLSYHRRKGFDSDIELAIVIQQMVDAEQSGVAFSLDTETGFRDMIIINAVAGLSESLVSGKATPDEYRCYKPNLGTKKRAIISRRVGSRNGKLVCAEVDGHSITREVPSTTKGYVLTDDQIQLLAEVVLEIESYYSNEYQRDCPVSVEWAFDAKGDLFILQARPETSQSQEDGQYYERYVIKEKGEKLVSGDAIGTKVSTGRARIVNGSFDFVSFKKGDVLVTRMTTPEWEPIMRNASAIVTEVGERDCHAAIVSRELGIPCIVNAYHARNFIYNRSPITVCCAEGATGNVYAGELTYKAEKVKLSELPRTKMKVASMVTAGATSLISNSRFIPGRVGFYITMKDIVLTHIGCYPLAAIYFNGIRDYYKSLSGSQLDKLWSLFSGCGGGEQFLFERLTEGVVSAALSVYPHDIIIDITQDFLNDVTLEGYCEFKSAERCGGLQVNPNAFLEAQCHVIHNTIFEYGFENIKIMFPRCDESMLSQMIRLFYEHDLCRKGLEFYLRHRVGDPLSPSIPFFDEVIISVPFVDFAYANVGGLHIDKKTREVVSSLISRIRKSGARVGILGPRVRDIQDDSSALVDLGVDSFITSPDLFFLCKIAIANAEAGKGSTGGV